MRVWCLSEPSGALWLAPGLGRSPPAGPSGRGVGEGQVLTEFPLSSVPRLPLPESDSLPLALPLRVEGPFVPVLLRVTPACPRSCSRALGLSWGDGAAVGSGLRAAGSLLGSFQRGRQFSVAVLSPSLSAQALVPVPQHARGASAAQEGTGLLAGALLSSSPSKSHLHGVFWSRQYSRGQEVRAASGAVLSRPRPPPPPAQPG